LRKYSQRTEWNVRDTDATAVFSISPNPAGGTALTIAVARRLEKPWLHLCREAASIAESAARLIEFLDEHRVRRLNIAGPRASQEPRVAAFVHDVLKAALSNASPKR
jgi:hypothetical protein